MNYWLLKTEPEDYSFSDLVQNGRDMWDGVRNHTAQRHPVSYTHLPHGPHTPLLRDHAQPGPVVHTNMLHGPGVHAPC